MASKTKSIRKESLEGVTPLSGHSMNQANLLISRDGERRFKPGKKLLKAMRREEKRKEYLQSERQKTDRILSRVMAKLLGYDENDPFVTTSETLYLLSRGIPLQDYIDGKIPLPRLLKISEL